MNNITKYWAFLYLLGNIFSQYTILGFLAQPTFYGLLGLGVVLLLMNFRTLMAPHMLRSHPFIYLFAFTLILYQVTWGIPYINTKSMTYLVAKVVCDFMFVVSIAQNAEFYAKKFYLYIPLFVAVLIAIGRFTGGLDSLTGRQTFGFGNANSLCSIGAVSAGCLFIQNEKLKLWHWIAIAVCAYGVLMGGSRTSMVALIFGFLFKHGFKLKTLLVIIAMYLAVLVSANMGVKFSGIDRLTSTVKSGDYVDDRKHEREATIMMIKKNPISGNGLYAENTGAAERVSKLGSHNGYLDLLKFMGVILGGLSIIVLLLNALKVTMAFYSSQDSYVRTHLFVVISVLAMAMYEAYIWGVNQMTTSFLFVSLAFLGHLLWLRANGYESYEETEEYEEMEEEKYGK